MMKEVAKIHVSALPHTWSSRHGERFVESLYKIVERLGFVNVVRRNGRVAGVVSGVGKLILTLVVEPQFQRGGIGKELIGQLPGKRYVYTEECSVGFYEKMGFERIGQIGKTIFLCRK